MYGNLIGISLFAIILLSCPVTSQLSNQTNGSGTNYTSNNTTLQNISNVSTITNTSAQTSSVIASTKNVNDACLDGLRELVLRQGYPKGSVFYCECVGTTSPYSCNAIFIDVGISATVSCDKNNRCSTKGNLGNLIK